MMHSVDNTLSLEEFYESLLNDRDKVIDGLVNRLKDYILCNDEINKVTLVKLNICANKLFNNTIYILFII